MNKDKRSIHFLAYGLNFERKLKVKRVDFHVGFLCVLHTCKENVSDTCLKFQSVPSLARQSGLDLSDLEVKVMT